jgi:hypothetical protein
MYKQINQELISETKQEYLDLFLNFNSKNF